MSSSPNLPSPSRLFSKKQASFIGDSHATSLPIDALAEFTSASKLILQAHASDHAEDDSIEPRKELGEKTNIKNPEGKSVKPRKLPVGKGESVVNVVKKARAPKKTQGESGKKAAEKNEIQDSKKRGRKSKGEVQTKIGKGNITKPGALNNEETKLVASAKNLKKTGQSVTQASIKKSEEIFPFGEEPLDLGLIEAIKRRKAWTPVKDTMRCTSRLECETTPSAELISKDCVSGQSGPSRFENLLGDYGYAKDDNVPVNDLETTRDTDGQASTKRRKIEVS